MSEGNWYDAYLAPAVVIGIIIAAIGGIRSYFSGKKSNNKEAKDLEDKTIQKAEDKGVKERSEAKILETEKIEAAEQVEEKREKEATKVKKESQEFVAEKFRFSDQEHAHQHAELKNELKELRTWMKQIAKDVEELKSNNKPLKY
jgi:heme/copper-type cytochrome/quinol oxidase subunit 1